MLLYWIWFAECKEISLLHKRRLLEQFGDPEEIYKTSDRAFERIELPEKERRALQEKDLHSAQEILRDCIKKEIHLLPITEDAYPSRLRNITDAPILLYYRGVLPDWESRPFIGIVGTRKASAYGLQISRLMGGQIAAGGGWVVSGCADGGDAAAMDGALDTGRPVVGVLGCGVDVVYPACNRKLFQRILAQKGCLLSEYPPQTKAYGWHFPVRNRIISGICNGSLVVEAPQKSGALITARHALEQGRDVFVVPGNINSESCKGSNALLQEGATPVLSGWDVLREYAIFYPGKLDETCAGKIRLYENPLAKVAQNPITPEFSPKKSKEHGKKPIDKEQISLYSELDMKKPDLGEQEQAVYDLLTWEPQEPADIIAKLNLPSGKVMSLLTMLTVKGLARKHPGGRISRK